MLKNATLAAKVARGGPKPPRQAVMRSELWPPCKSAAANTTMRRESAQQMIDAQPLSGDGFILKGMAELGLRKFTEGRDDEEARKRY